VTAVPVAFVASVGQSLPDGHYSVTPGSGGAVVLSTTAAANVATLAADGANPTQAHVNTLNTNFALLKAPLDRVTAAGAIAVIVDTTAVTKRNQVLEAFKNILAQMDGSGLFAA
jgi:flagellar hook-basal body complex protein FliE